MRLVSSAIWTSVAPVSRSSLPNLAVISAFSSAVIVMCDGQSSRAPDAVPARGLGRVERGIGAPDQVVGLLVLAHHGPADARRDAHGTGRVGDGGAQALGRACGRVLVGVREQRQELLPAEPTEHVL